MARAPKERADDDLDALADALADRLRVPLLLTGAAAAKLAGLSVAEWKRLKASARPGTFPRPRRIEGRAEPMYHKDDVRAWADARPFAPSALPRAKSRTESED